MPPAAVPTADTAARPVLSVPEVAAELGVTLWVVARVFARRPELAALLVRSGGRRLLLREHLPRVREALAARYPRGFPGAAR